MKKYYVSYEEPYTDHKFDREGMRAVYFNDVDRSEYPNFEDWMYDMLKSGVFEECE